MAALGSLNLLKKRLPLDDRDGRLLDNAIQAAERGAALTQRLLAFARRQELQPQAVNVIQVIDGIENLLQRAIGPGVRFAKQLPGQLSPVLVDANQLELALLNLAVNARDAMPDGGIITVLAEEQSVSTARPKPNLKSGHYVRIRVSDNGCGMDEATLAKAAEPFFTTKGPGKGTGLGLSMVHGLAAQSGGTLMLSSAPAQGTSVDLWLPVAAAGSAPAVVSADAPDPIPALNFVARTVLVVDDDALVGMGTAAMLEDLGHTAIEVMSGAKALEALTADQRIDLVITDHAMPGMTGAELARRIRASRPELPIILASGYAELPDNEGLADLLRLGKPFAQAQLAAAIERAVKMVA
ncbi:CheY-like chemotaxis protein [Bosea sp. OAE506]